MSWSIDGYRRVLTKNGGGMGVRAGEVGCVTDCNGAWSEGARSRRLAATEGEEQPMPKLRRGMGD